MKIFSSIFALTFSTTLFAAACGGTSEGAPDAEGDSVSEAEAISARITPGSFKLYGQPGATPSPACDIHTKLELKASYFSTATLEEAVSGMCEIAVVPNARTYRLRLAGESCGTRIYSGSLTKAGKRTEIRITDNRGRLCRDLVEAKIIVEETRDGQTVKRYSADGAAAEQVTVTGKLVRSFGIGGENTGTSIQEGAGLTELVLDDGERNQFEDGKTARVKGRVVYLSGVETHNRRAIDVAEMLVCPSPGQIGCMPAPNVRLSSLCSGENRTWVEAHCPGVDYVD